MLYLNGIIIACLWYGFGYDIFRIKNVVKTPGATIPWAYSIVKENNKYGFVDWHGNEVLPCEFDELIPPLHESNKEHVNTSFILAKRVRCLNITNEGLLSFLHEQNTVPPLYYHNNRLFFGFFPNYENHIKNLSRSEKEEEILASKILTNGRLKIIQSFGNRNLLYNKELYDDINRLFVLNKNSLCKTLSQSLREDVAITDVTIKDIRTSLCKCICSLHLLETFGKTKQIEDNDIAHAITALQYFSVFEIMDDRLQGYVINFNETLNWNLQINDQQLEIKEMANSSLSGIHKKDTRDVYSAFKMLYMYDLGVHQTDFRNFLEAAEGNANQIYNELLGISNQQENLNSDVSDVKTKVIQNVESIVANSDDLKSALSKIEKLKNLQSQTKDFSRRFDNLVSKSLTVTEKQLFKHNADLFDYRSVIKPLIRCIAENDIPDQSTALTDITCRLMIMGMFRGLEMHDYIEELNKAYRMSQERTMRKTFETVSTIDRMEYKYIQMSNEFKSKLKKMTHNSK